MAGRHRRRARSRLSPGELVARALDGFLAEPDAVCPKCQGSSVEWYDPYLLSPWRTLTNRRRLKCRTCGFVWRRSRTTRNSGLMGGG